MTDAHDVPSDWSGQRGFITPEMIQMEVPNYHDNIFYISGPQSMVNHFKSVLKQMGVPSGHVKSDFFPGFA